MLGGPLIGGEAREVEDTLGAHPRSLAHHGHAHRDGHELGQTLISHAKTEGHTGLSKPPTSS